MSRSALTSVRSRLARSSRHRPTHRARRVRRVLRGGWTPGSRPLPTHTARRQGARCLPRVPPKRPNVPAPLDRRRPAARWCQRSPLAEALEQFVGPRCDRFGALEQSSPRGRASLRHRGPDGVPNDRRLRDATRPRHAFELGLQVVGQIHRRLVHATYGYHRWQLADLLRDAVGDDAVGCRDEPQPVIGTAGCRARNGGRDS